MTNPVDSPAATATLSPLKAPVSNHALRVRVAAREFRLPLSALAGVADCPRLVRVPSAPAWLIGVGGLHGRLLPVVDLAAAETGRRPGSTPGPRVLLVEVSGHMVGFSVDDVSVEPESAEPTQGSELSIHALAARLLKSGFEPSAGAVMDDGPER